MTPPSSPLPDYSTELDPVERQLQFRTPGPMPMEMEFASAEQQPSQESDLSGMSPHSNSISRNIGSPPGPDPVGNAHSTSNTMYAQTIAEHSTAFHHQQQQQQFDFDRMPPIVAPQVHQQLPPLPVPVPAQHANANNGYQNANNGYQNYAPPSTVFMAPPPAMGKRKIHLRLVEDVTTPTGKRASFLSFRRKAGKNYLTSPGFNKKMNTNNKEEEQAQPQPTERGRVTVSWYEGTTSLELYDHVRNSVMRKLDLHLHGTVKLADLRILDESSNPPEGTFLPIVCRLLVIHFFVYFFPHIL